MPDDASSSESDLQGAGEGVMCGGFAALPCGQGLRCVDSPDDGCDRDNGGADCGGVCVKEGVLVAADDGETVTVGEGEDVVVELASNPTTGFAWQVVATDKNFGHPATEFVAGGDRAGAPGVQRFTWKTRGPLSLIGEHHVKMEYSRAEDKDAAPAKTFSFTVQILRSACPELMPPGPGFCSEGHVEAKENAHGCTVYECVTDCRVDGCESGRCQRCRGGGFFCIADGQAC